MKKTEDSDVFYYFVPMESEFLLLSNKRSIDRIVGLLQLPTFQKELK